MTCNSPTESTLNITAMLADILSKAFKNDRIELSQFREEIRQFLNQVNSQVDLLDIHLLSVIRQLDFLLEDGTTVFSTVRTECNSWMTESLVIERVAQTGNEFTKTVVKASLQILAGAPGACCQYLGVPSFIVFSNAIEIVDDLHQPYEFIKSRDFLNRKELKQFFQNKQEIVDRIRQSVAESQKNPARQSMDAIERDKTITLEIFSNLKQNPSQSVYAVTRASHPFMSPILHILPRLLNGAENQESSLSLIKNSLKKIDAMGFGVLMLGLVDKQTSHIYYGEDDAGKITGYVNNHGYWSSGEIGVDASLGSDREYIQLAQAAKENKIMLMQDVIFSSLGYPAQIARLALSQLQNPTQCLMVGGDEVNICDHNIFLHETCIPEENSLDEFVSPEIYANVVAKFHTGSLYALPKPNLFNPEVLDAILQRALWQIKTAGIAAFRIDMAKHIGVLQLCEIILTLRDECRKRDAALALVGNNFRILLEYWTTKYRDLKFAMSAVATQSEGVYFYDFPLAQALQDIFIWNKDFHETILMLINERTRWGINLYQMIPTFIDHDFSFRPIYNGNDDTRAMVVVGYAISAMLSANAPYVYFAYDKSESGVPTHRQSDQNSEAFSRKMTSEIFATSDPRSPAGPLAKLFGILRENAIFSHWTEASIDVSQHASCTTISRTFNDQTAAKQIKLEASFSLYSQDDAQSEDGSILFSYCHGPSVIIRKTEMPI